MAGALSKRRTPRGKAQAGPRAAKSPKAKGGAAGREEDISASPPSSAAGTSTQVAEPAASEVEAPLRRIAAGARGSRFAAAGATGQARRATGLRSFAEATEHETQVVTFQLGKEEYAIDILQVQEIVMMTEITRMPRAPRFIEGIVNLRGQMIPIIDMHKRFDMPSAEHTEDTRIIIVDIGEEIVGMVVDGVRDVIRLPDSAVSPPPPMIKGISAEYLKGIGQFDERLLIMLELGKVLSAEEQTTLRRLGPDGCPLGIEPGDLVRPQASGSSGK